LVRCFDSRVCERRCGRLWKRDATQLSTIKGNN
jgi:hypothetical protein